MYYTVDWSEGRAAGYERAIYYTYTFIYFFLFSFLFFILTTFIIVAQLLEPNQPSLSLLFAVSRVTLNALIYYKAPSFSSSYPTAGVASPCSRLDTSKKTIYT